MPPAHHRVPPAGVSKPIAPRLPAALRPAALPADDLSDEDLLSGLHFRGVDLSSRTVRLVDIDSTRFDDCRLADGRFDRVSLVDVVLERCDLANLTLEHSSMSRADLVGCRATGLRLGGAILRNVRFQDCIAD